MGHPHPSKGTLNRGSPQAFDRVNLALSSSVSIRG